MALPAPAIALLAAEQLLHCTYESFGLRDRKCALLRQSKVYHFSQNPRSRYRPLHLYNHCDVSKWRLRSLVSELAGFFTLCWYSGDRSAEAIELKDLERYREFAESFHVTSAANSKNLSRNRKRALFIHIERIHARFSNDLAKTSRNINTRVWS